jgi:hypothetical protein
MPACFVPSDEQGTSARMQCIRCSGSLAVQPCEVVRYVVVCCALTYACVLGATGPLVAATHDQAAAATLQYSLLAAAQLAEPATSAFNQADNVFVCCLMH